MNKCGLCQACQREVVLWSCDGCNERVCTNCADLTASEEKVMELKKGRKMRFYCKTCIRPDALLVEEVKALRQLMLGLGSAETIAALVRENVEKTMATVMNGIITDLREHLGENHKHIIAEMNRLSNGVDVLSGGGFAGRDSISFSQQNRDCVVAANSDQITLTQVNRAVNSALEGNQDSDMPRQQTELIQGSNLNLDAAAFVGVSAGGNRSNNNNKTKKTSKTQLMSNDPRKKSFHISRANSSSTTSTNEAWEAVSSRKNGRRRDGVVATGKSRPGIISVPKKAYIFVSRFAPGTTVNDVKGIIEDSFPEVECESIRSRYPQCYSSFKIGVDVGNKAGIMDPAVWPAGIFINQFFRSGRRGDTDRAR